jgi:hypothetical protein
MIKYVIPSTITNPVTKINKNFSILSQQGVIKSLHNNLKIKYLTTNNTNTSSLKYLSIFSFTYLKYSILSKRQPIELLINENYFNQYLSIFLSNPAPTLFKNNYSFIKNLKSKNPLSIHTLFSAYLKITSFRKESILKIKVNKSFWGINKKPFIKQSSFYKNLKFILKNKHNYNYINIIYYNLKRRKLKFIFYFLRFFHFKKFFLNKTFKNVFIIKKRRKYISISKEKAFFLKTSYFNNFIKNFEKNNYNNSYHVKNSTVNNTKTKNHKNNNLNTKTL